MVNYVIRRLLLIPVLLFGVTVLLFAMLSLLSPVERSALYVKDIPKNERALDGVIKLYGLDQPIHVQYWRWLVGVRNSNTGEVEGGILRGDLGFSRSASEPVIDMIRRRFPATLELALWSVLPVTSGGIILGVIAAVNHDKPVDHIARVFSIVGGSLPDFVFGLLMLMLFYGQLEWFPPGRISDWANRAIQSPEFRSYTRLLTFDALLNLRLDIFWDALRHLVLPVITLSYLSLAVQMRVTRASMLETLRQDYITTARSKGVPDKVVVRRHALPNALLPVITLAGRMVIGLLSGVVVVETVFTFPGVGSAAAYAGVGLDVITVLAFMLFNGLILIVANVVIDVLYAYIDPRVRLG
jgi:peptide/nickel transport system permease protein